MPAHAQTWSGAATPDTSFSNGSNWVGNTAPASSTASTVVFGPATPSTVTFDANVFSGNSNFDIGTLRVQTGGAFTFNYSESATQVSLTGGVDVQAGASAQFNLSNDVVFQILAGSAQNATFGVGANARLEFQNGANAGNATVTNNGTLAFFGGSHTSTATITTNAGGTVSINDSSSGGTGRLIFNGDGKLDITGLGNASTSIGSIESTSTTSQVLLGNKQLIVGGNNLDTSYAGVISGTGGSLRKNGTGTLTLTGTNTYTGGTTIAGGTLAISSDGNLGGAAGALTFAGGALLLNGNVTSARTVALSSTGTIDTNGNSMTLSGAIGGGGGLTKTGAGTLTLTNATSDYLGATTINGGTLAIASGGRIASAVTNNATFTNAGTIDNTVTNNGTFNQSAGSINGTTTNTGTVNASGGTFSGAFNNNGSGVVNVTGAVTSNATFSVASNARLVVAAGGNLSAAGGLINNGSNGVTVAAGGALSGVVGNSGRFVNSGTVTSSSFVNNANSTFINNGTFNGNLTSNDATLGGTGTIAGSVALNGGILAPGNSIGTMTVTGNLTFTSAATYLVEIDAASSDRTNVTGTATLNGAQVSAIYANGSYVTRRYTILNAAGGVVGTFASLVNTNLPANFTPRLSYDANNVFLDLTLNFTPTPTPAPPPAAPAYGSGLSRNQENVANALISSFNTAGGIPMVFGLLNADGLTRVSGEAATGIQQTTYDAMDRFTSMLLDPFLGDRGTTAEPDAFAAMPRKALPQSTFAQRFSVWSAGYGATQSTSGDAATGSTDLRTRVYGAAAGLDYRLSPDALLGFALGGASTKYSLANSMGGGSAEMFQAGVYGRSDFGPAYIATALAYGWQDATTDRSVFLNSLRGDFNAYALSGRLEAGRRLATNAGGLTPYAAGQFTSVFLPGYAEQVITSVNTFALNYAGKDATAARSELGLRADTTIALQDARVTLRGRAAWAHNFNTDRRIAALFQTLPASDFTVAGASPAGDAALLSASAETRWRNGLSVAASFESEFSRVTESYAGKGTVRYQW